MLNAKTIDSWRSSSKGKERQKANNYYSEQQEIK